jgi:hypothetical protein
MHEEGDHPFASRFDSKAIYSTLVEYFGSKNWLLQYGQGVLITVTEAGPVDLTQPGRVAKWVEVQGENFGELPRSKFFYNSPALIILWGDVEVSVQYDFIDDVGLLQLMTKFYPGYAVPSMRDSIAENTRQAEIEALKCEKVFGRISDSVREKVFNAVKLAFQDQDRVDKESVRGDEMEIQLQADLLRALNQFIAGYSHYLLKERSIHAQYPIHDSLRKIDFILSRWI